jgi:hypothetical protein
MTQDEVLETLRQAVRNHTLEEVAQEFERMRIAFGDTAHSFAQYVREMKSEE